jgi:hypothetical protein
LLYVESSWNIVLSATGTSWISVPANAPPPVRRQIAGTSHRVIGDMGFLGDGTQMRGDAGGA